MDNQNPRMFSACAIAASVVIIASVGCSSGSKDTAAEDNPTRIVIDGQSRTVEGNVVCVDGPTGEVSIELDPLDAAPDEPVTDPIVLLDLTPRGDAPSVSLLTITLPDIGLSTGRYRQHGLPTASKAGNTYTVKGEGSVLGTPPKSQIYKPFELEITCP